MAKYIPIPEEIESHFRSLTVTKKQLRFIDNVLFKNQYIVVDRGPQAINAYIEMLKKKGKPIGKIKASARIGHCTHCHHEWIIPDDWKVDNNEQNRKSCPICHSKNLVISAKKGRKAKTIMAYVLFWETSKKDRDVVLAKAVVAVRPIEGDYRTCTTMTYPVTMYYFKIGRGGTMYYRDVWYSHKKHTFDCYLYGWYQENHIGPDGLGSNWERQQCISDLYRKYWDRGYAIEGDYQSFLQTIKNSNYKYCQAVQFFENTKDWRWNNEAPDNQDCLKYVECYSQYPQIEYLVKSGLDVIVYSKTHNQSTAPAVRWQSKQHNHFLRFRLTREDRQYMKTKKVSMDALNMLAIIQQSGQYTVSLKEAEQFKNEIGIWRIKKIDTLPDIRKLRRYAKIQAGGNNEIDIQHILQDYLDYLDECKYLHYDMKDRRNLWPRDFIKAHRHTSHLVNVMKEQERLQKMKQKNELLNKQIENQVKKLEYYRFAAGNYMLRPIASAEEMILEGWTNHNCVANYIEEYAEGKTNIFVIREKDNPDIPFYTMEIRNGRIIQCRTDCNKIAPKGSDIEAFIDLFDRVKMKKNKEAMA